MNQTNNWGDHIFIRVSKKQYENFIRYFNKKHKIEGNFFMGWYDSYDWTLRKSEHSIGSWEAAQDCMVARCYCETTKPEYWLRKDYIEANNYDINTITPEPTKPKLTKQEKEINDHICDAFDYVFNWLAANKFEEDNK